MHELTRKRIFLNARIHTMDAARPAATVLAVAGGRIAYVGEDAREAARLLPGAETTDCSGYCLVPGLIDSHMHFIMEGLRLNDLDIAGKSRSDILRLVAEAAATKKPGEWILGRGWNNTLWEDASWPSKEELNAAAPVNPTALTRLDGHSLWVNSRALEAAGLNRNSPEMPGGEMLRNSGGDLLGILVDTPAFLVRSAVPPYTETQKRAACLAAQAEMFGYGVTSVSDAWMYSGDFCFLRRFYEEGSLRIRMYGMLASRPEKPDAPFPLPEPVSGLYGNRLSLRAFKVVLDGSLGSRSAWLTRAYADRPGHTGSHRYTDESLLALLRPAAAKGYQICIHAIGDAAVLQAVSAFEALRAEKAAAPIPHRIEHLQIASAQTIARVIQAGLIPAMQTMHAEADKKMAETRLPPALLAEAYPWRGVMNAGGIIANGSDSPMDGANPFFGFHAAVARRPFSLPDGGKIKAQRLTREEALLSYTLWAARAELAETFKGSLSPGKAADFAVLDRDILRCPPEETRETRVLTTVLAGETVYGGL